MIKLNNPAIEPWMEELWAWADENCLSEQDIPRNTSDLVNLQKFSSTIYISETEQTLRYINPLPKAFSNLKNLKHLDLSNSNLKSVPAFMIELISLEIFKINNNKIKTLPKTINKLVKLKLLDIELC